MSGSMASPAAEDREVFAWEAGEPFAGLVFEGRPWRMARIDDDRDPEDEPLDDVLADDDDLDDDELGDEEIEGDEDDELDEDLDDELIDLDDEYDDTDVDDRPHPGHRYVE